MDAREVLARAIDPTAFTAEDDLELWRPEALAQRRKCAGIIADRCLAALGAAGLAVVPRDDLEQLRVAHDAWHEGPGG